MEVWITKLVFIFGSAGILICAPGTVMLVLVPSGKMRTVWSPMMVPQRSRSPTFTLSLSVDSSSRRRICVTCKGWQFKGYCKSGLYGWTKSIPWCRVGVWLCLIASATSEDREAYGSAIGAGVGTGAAWTTGAGGGG